MGIDARSLFHLIQTVPEMTFLMQRRFEELTPERLMEMGPDAVSKVIAMGIVAAQDDSANARLSGEAWKKAIEKEAKIAIRLGFPDQLKLISAILEITFPEGVGPFVVQLNNMAGKFNTATSALLQTTGGTEPATKSTEQLSAAFVTDGVKIARGVPPPAN